MPRGTSTFCRRSQLAHSPGNIWGDTHSEHRVAASTVCSRSFDSRFRTSIFSRSEATQVERRRVAVFTASPPV
jgi:hypothetical protein